jgi:O-antigen/teichoic acid export membrane protein
MSALHKVHPLVWYATAYGGTAALLKGIGFVLFLWLARSLSVEDYATFGLYYALQTGIATLAIAGIGESVVGLLKEHEPPPMRAKLFGAANAVFALMGAASIGMAILLFGLLAQPTTGSTYGVALVIVVGMLTAFLSLQAGLVRLEERHLATLSLSFVGPLAGLAGGFIGFLNEQSVSAFFLGSAVGLSLSVLVLGMYGIGFYGFVGRMRETSPILLRIAPFIGITFLGWLSGYGNSYFIKALFEPSDVATFTFAFTLASIMQLVASSLNQVWGPRFYRIVHKKPLEDVERENRRFFRWQGIAMGLAGGMVIAIFPSAIDVIGGNLIAYRGIQAELLLLFAAYVVLIPWWHCQNYFLVHGKGQELMRVVLRTSVMGVFSWLLLMWFLGPLGIYLGFLVQMLMRMSGLVISAKEHWPVTIAWDGVAAALVLLGAGFTVSVSGLSTIAAW